MVQDDNGKMVKHNLDISDDVGVFAPIVKTTLRLLSEFDATN